MLQLIRSNHKKKRERSHRLIDSFNAFASTLMIDERIKKNILTIEAAINQINQSEISQARIMKFDGCIASAVRVESSRVSRVPSHNNNNTNQKASK